VKIARPFGDSIGFSYINIYFTYCSEEKNETRKCKSKSELDKIFASYYSEVKFISYYNNHQNFEIPYRPIITKIVELSSVSFFKRIYAYIKNSNYCSDSGLLFNFYDYYERTIFESSKTIIDFREKEFRGGKLLIQFTFTFNENGIEENYFRSYKKIQNIIAEVGGLIKIVKMIFSFFAYLYTEINFTENILNNKIILYSNENGDDESLKINKNSNRFIKEMNIASDLNIKPKKNNYMLQKINDSLDNPNMILPNSKYSFDINKKELLGNKLSHKNSKSDLHNLSKDRKSDVVKSSLKRGKLPIGIMKLSEYLFKNQNQSIYKQTKHLLLNHYLSISNLIKMRNEINSLKFYIFSDKKILEFFKISENILKIPMNKKTNNDDKSEFSSTDAYFNYYFEIEENQFMLNDYFNKIC